MGQTNEAAAFVRRLKTGRFAAKGAAVRDTEGGESQEQPVSILGVVIIVLVLAAGVAGVLLFGPAKTMDAAKEFVRTRKAPAADTSTGNDPESQAKPARTIAHKHRIIEMIATRPAPLPPAPPLPPVPPAAIPQPGLRIAGIRLGMLRRELLELCGAPDLKTTASEGGHMVENYAYVSPSRPARMVVLKDGRVVVTGAN